MRHTTIFAEVAAVAMVAVTLPGARSDYRFDVDHDRDVDLLDFAILGNCLSGPHGLPPTGCTSAMDSDEDGDVDLLDLAVFQLQFTGTRVPAFVPSKHVGFELIGIHDEASGSYDGDCLRCHADRLHEVALDGVTPTAHSRMLRQFGGADWLCLACHSQVDFVNQSGSNLREQVNMEELGCTSCHGPDAAPGVTQFYVR